jgi:hypothetical protein
MSAVTWSEGSGAMTRYHVLHEVGTDATPHVSQNRAVAGREQLSELPRLALFGISGLVHQHVYVRIEV